MRMPKSGPSFAVILFLVLTLAPGLRLGAECNLSLAPHPYLRGGIFTDKVLPVEGHSVTITIRADCEGPLDSDPRASVTVLSRDGRIVFKRTVSLARSGDHAQGSLVWRCERNGLYRLAVRLDPGNVVAETDESDNEGELLLPVLSVERRLQFAWYRVPQADVRWATCITATEDLYLPLLRERGILPLRWEFGGMPFTTYDRAREQSDPEGLLAELEETFYDRYTRKLDLPGFGLDEYGGYPGGFRLAKSVASMKAVIRARKAMPGRFFAAWNSGGLDPELAGLYRRGVDLLLFEAYVFWAIPNDLGTEDIYQMIRDRMDPLVRARDMIVPAYGNPCTTLVALDTSTFPERIDPGEQEQVVRFIRRSYPEIRGMAWYNGTYRSDDPSRESNKKTMENADRLCFEYFIKPCLTLMRKSLWVSRLGDRVDMQEGSSAGAGYGCKEKVEGDGYKRWVLTAAVSNIGGMDSGRVTVAFYVDGRAAGWRTARQVPAGANRNSNRVLLKLPIALETGNHNFEARIISAEDATVLDGTIRESVFVSE